MIYILTNYLRNLWAYEVEQWNNLTKLVYWIKEYKFWFFALFLLRYIQSRVPITISISFLSFKFPTRSHDCKYSYRKITCCYVGFATTFWVQVVRLWDPQSSTASHDHQCCTSSKQLLVYVRHWLIKTPG